MEIENWLPKQIDKEILKSIYDCKLVHDGGLKIYLFSKEHSICLTYNRFVSYRYAEESYLLDYWHFIKENNIQGLIFFKLVDSSYFNEIKTLSNDFLVDGGGDSMEHHAIFTADECFEIITDASPEISVYDGRFEE